MAVTVDLKRAPLRSIAGLAVVALLAHVLAMPLLHQSARSDGKVALSTVCTVSGVRSVTLDASPEGGGNQQSPIRCLLCCPGFGTGMAPGPIGFTVAQLEHAEPAPSRLNVAPASDLWQDSASARGPPHPS